MPEYTNSNGEEFFFEQHGNGPATIFIKDDWGLPTDCDPQDILSQIVSKSSAALNWIEGVHRFTHPRDLAPFSYEQAAADLIHQIKAVTTGSIRLVGVGIGALIALKIAQVEPALISRVVCINPLGKTANNSFSSYLNAFDATIRCARGFGMKKLVESAVEAESFHSDKFGCPFARELSKNPTLQQSVESMRVERYIIDILKFRDSLYPCVSEGMIFSSEDLEKISTPCLVVPGNNTYSPIESAQFIAGHLEKGRVFAYENDTTEILEFLGKDEL